MGFWVFDSASSESKSITASTSSTSANNNTQTSSSYSRGTDRSIRSYSSVANYKAVDQINGHLRTYVAPVEERGRINACSSVASCTINGGTYVAPVEELRRINACSSVAASCTGIDDINGGDNRNYVALDRSLQIMDFNSMFVGVLSDDDKLQLEATAQYYLRLLSIGQRLSIQEVIQSGVLPRFIQFLAREDFPQLQYEAAKVLRKIASGTSENVQVLIDHGVIPIFVKLLASPINDVSQEAASALGNFAAESPKSRDLVLSHGALVSLLPRLNKHTVFSVLQTASWTLSMFCKGKPQPQFEQMRPALPALGHLLHSNDEIILLYACLALVYLSDGTHDTIQAVIESGVCPRLVELLLHPSHKVVANVLSTVINIVKGDHIQSQIMVNCGALPCLLSLLTHDNEKNIKRLACYTISCFTARNKEQIQAVIEAALIAPLVNLLQNAEFEIKMGALMAIMHATRKATTKQIKYLVSQGCIKPLCDLLVCPDLKIVNLCLKALKNILEVGGAEKNLRNSGDTNKYAQMIDDAGGVEKLESLQSHENTEIYEKAVRVLETYRLVEDDET